MRRRLDITLLLDRLRCELFGHVTFTPTLTDTPINTPWERPRCWRCGTRLQRPR